MRIQYISVHAVLEYDEAKLLAELGYNMRCNGSYRDPHGAHTLPRPGIVGIPIDPHFFNLTAIHPKTKLPPELIEPYDAIIIMHQPDVVVHNWPNIKHKRVIWRTIGQSTPGVEKRLEPMRKEGLQIVRYSPLERKLENYLGEDAMIRFYKDPYEYGDWDGRNARVMNCTQSLLGRKYFCHYDELVQMFYGFDQIVFGSGNDDLGPLNGGEIAFDALKEELRRNRVYAYGGTWPAAYTLSFIEAWMTGIPMVSIGRGLAEARNPAISQSWRFFEVPDLIENGVDGFYSDDLKELNETIGKLLNDVELAKKIGQAGRKKAIEIFGKDKIAKQWKEFLG